jgi:hypothetical protein
MRSSQKRVALNYLKRPLVNITVGGGKVSEEIKVERVEWGVVTRIFSGNTVYVIYGPPFAETAQRVAERLRASCYDVVMLNEGNDYDADVAEKLRALALQHDC